MWYAASAGHQKTVVRIRFLFHPVLLLAVSSAALGQQLHFEKLEPSVIEARLKTNRENDIDRAAQLKQLFTEAGCQGQQAEQAVKGDKLPNVICTLPGSTDHTIIVGAHFDHTGAGKGIIDNWTGAALLASLYQSLRTGPRRHTFIFVGFSGEERGLKGSRSYVKQMSQEQVSKTSAMVNMDSLALAPTKIWVSYSDVGLVRSLWRIADSMQLTVAGVNVDPAAASTDSVSFSDRKIPAITVHSVTQETVGVLHSTKDDWEAVKLNEYYDTYHLMTAYLAYLDVTLDQEKGAGESPAPAADKP